MSFHVRAVVALLSGVGAGTIGFWLAWRFIDRILGADPGIGYNFWLVSAIFGPGVLAYTWVFMFLSRLHERQAVFVQKQPSPSK